MARLQAAETALSRKESGRVVVASVLANVAVTVVKVIAAALTGSAALAAEAVHSGVDTFDALLLLLGRKLADKPPDARHPFGHGKEVYFWSLVVAMMVFGAGGCATLYEGAERLRHPQPMTHAWVMFVVLGAAALFEGYSFTVALKAFIAYRDRRMAGYSLWRAIRAAKDPTVFSVVLEDSAALVGLLVAFAGVLLSVTLHEPRFDAAASLVIGAVLIAMAWVLGHECRGLLVGERALPSVVEAFRARVERHPAVAAVLELKTMHIGPDRLLVTLKLCFRPRADVGAAAAELGRALREQNRDVVGVFVDADSFASASGA